MADGDCVKVSPKWHAAPGCAVGLEAVGARLMAVCHTCLCAATPSDTYADGAEARKEGHLSAVGVAVVTKGAHV